MGSGQGKKLYVLIVDDSQSILESSRKVLSEKPYQVLTATSSKKAQRIMDGKEIAVAVSDYAMSGETGLQFLGRVAKTHPNSTRILMSAVNHLDHNIHYFLAKPLDMPKFMDMIKKGVDDYTARIRAEKKKGKIRKGTIDDKAAN